MTNKNDYQSVILEMLQGQTEELRAIPRERLDWAGPAAVLRRYRKASGKERSAMIRAIGQVIQNHPGSPAVIAQLIDIASGLDLAEVEPQVRKLQSEPFASQEPVRDAIVNFLAFRNLSKKLEKPTTMRIKTAKEVARQNRRSKTTMTDVQRAVGKVTRGRS